jgi:hypothetical protein
MSLLLTAIALVFGIAFVLATLESIDDILRDRAHRAALLRALPPPPDAPPRYVGPSIRRR